MTVCYREIKDEEDTVKLQSDINRFGFWARKWGMRFQPVKCNMMQLTAVVLQEELESVQRRAARFVTGNYNYETRSMTGILVQLKWESLMKRRKDNRHITI